MAMAEAALASTTTYGSTRGGTLADVVELILDKGLVIDAFIRVSLIGIEVLTIDARIVIASVDTYLRFAEAVNRLDLTQTKQATTFEDIMEGSSKKKTKGALEGAREGASGLMRRGEVDEDEDQEEQEEPSRSERRGGRARGEESRSERGQEREGVMARMAKRGRYS
jgi:gas vesicle structural protein